MASIIKPPVVSDLPPWAKWLAQDADGLWLCFSHRPIYIEQGVDSYWESDDGIDDTQDAELWTTFSAIDAESTLVKIER
jgi:hypothetical protein